MTEFLSGWYVDPSDSRRVRYWDGTQWTRDTWNLAEVQDVVIDGPAPPLVIELDDAADADDMAAWAPAHLARRRYPRNAIIIGALAAIGVVAAAAWLLLT